MRFILAMNRIHTSANDSSEQLTVADLAQIDTNLLVTLDALLKEQNVTRTAARLGLTQSAVSHRLRKLRKQFNDPLLVGADGGLVPTAQADRLRQPLRDALTALSAVLDATASFDAATSQRQFVVSGTDFGEFAFGPQLIEHFAAVSPLANFRIRPPTANIYSDLESGKLDLHIGPGLSGHAGVRRRRLANDPFALIVRPGHALTRGALTLKRYAAASHWWFRLTEALAAWLTTCSPRMDSSGAYNW